MNEPVGSLCVLRDDDLTGWAVSICRGGGKREFLNRFATQGEAAEFALAERDRRRASGLGELVVHFPDDCPCHGGVPRP